MKAILSQITSVVLISIPILLALALFVVALKKAGDRQYRKDKAAYDKQYARIQGYIREMNEKNYTFIENCIIELEKLPYKNPEKTSALYRELEGTFKRKMGQHIETLKNEVYV